jgi:hypothetical protein
LRTTLAAALILGLPLLTSPALAHAELVSAVPAAEATVSAPPPTELRLTFSEPIELAFTRVTVKGGDGQALALGVLGLDPADAMTLIVPLAAALPAGTAMVEWTAVAADGHKSNGSYTLTVKN